MESISNSIATNGRPDRPAPEGFQWTKVRKPGIEGDTEWVLWRRTVITISGSEISGRQNGHHPSNNGTYNPLPPASTLTQ